MMKKPVKQIVFVSYGDILFENGYKTRLLGELSLIAQWPDYEKYLISFEKRSSFEKNKDGRIKLKKELARLGIKLILVPRQNRFQFDFYRDERLFKKILSEIGYTNGILHGQSIYGTKLALAGRQKFGGRVIFDMHGLIGPEWDAAGKNWFKKWINEWLERECILKSDYVLAASESLANFVKDRYKRNNVFTLPCLTDIDFGLESTALKISHKPVGVYLGGAQSWQGIKLLRKFVRENDIFLLVVTSQVASFHQKLADLPTDSFKIISAKHDDVPKYLQQADFGLILREENPLNKIAFPTKLAEYMLCGLPVIHNDTVEAVTKIIDENDLGFNTNSGNFQEWWKNWSRSTDYNSERIKKYARENLTWSSQQTKVRYIYEVISRPKILYILTTSAWGGVQKYVTDLSININKQGWLSTVAFGMDGDDGRLIDMLTETNTRSVIFPRLYRDIRPLDDWFTLWDMYREIKLNRYDVVHSNSSKAGILGRLAAWLAGVPKNYYTAHGWVFNEDLPWWKKEFYWWWEWLGALFATKIFCVSEYDNQRASDTGLCPAHKLITIYNGIGDIDLGPYQDEFTLKLADWKQQGYKIIGSTGNFYKNKNYPLFIEIARKLSERNDKFRFVLVGDGPEKENLLKLIKKYDLESIFLMPGRYRRHLWLMQSFDVFMLTSTKEGFPYVLLQAGQLKIPIVTSSVGGIPELITDRETGFLINKHNIDAYLAAIETIFADQPQIQLITNRLYDKISENFRLGKKIRQYLSYYEGN